MEKTSENGCNSYQIRRSQKFETSYKNLVKTHYSKDAKSRQEFEQLIAAYIEQLANHPCNKSISDAEPFPGKTAHPDFEFRKKRWSRLPGLQGAARYGRLIFVVYHPKKLVYLIWIYTHAEYQKTQSRPPDKDLESELKIVQNMIDTDNETSQD